MLTGDFWWPLDLSAAEEAAVRARYAKLASRPVRIDGTLLAQSDRVLSQLMAAQVEEILDRDGLPHLCHVVNGWGDGSFGGRKHTERMTAFVHRSPDGKPYVLQRDPEGEFHPWQSLAYAVMAGVDPDRELAADGPTPRTLALTSRCLNTSAGHELGHLLYALAHLDPSLDGSPFQLLDRVVPVEGLFDMAVDAHHQGSFEVCRKFHLTEGIAAMAALVPGLEHRRATAQGFIDGQLDILFVLAAMLEEVRHSLERRARHQPDGLLAVFRNSLIVGDYFENHAYYAGHLIELGGLAAILGYPVKEAHRAAMAVVMNEINATLPGLARRLSFSDCFLHFGHYRRAMTLLAELDAVGWQAEAVRRESLQRYAVDFDAFPRGELPQAEGVGAHALELGLYELERTASNPRARFLDVVAEYAKGARAGLHPRGRFDHFRRIGPAGWPRAFHYELLDYGEQIGVELHLESDAVAPLKGVVQRRVPQVERELAPVPVEWDPTWWKGRGRLRAVYPDSVPAGEVARGMATLISTTFEEVDPAARTLPVPPLHSFALPAGSSGALLSG